MQRQLLGRSHEHFAKESGTSFIDVSRYELELDFVPLPG